MFRTILVAIVMLGLGSGGAAFWFMSAGRAAASTAHGDGAAEWQDEPAGPEPAVVSLPTFTVNLADKPGARYLRTTISLLVPDHKKAAELTGSGGHKGGENVAMAVARSAVLELLTTKTSDELTTAEGKQALKAEIAQRVSRAFRTKVSDVLFAEFVVQ
ncbi:MAG TPA: flagellar basal body-associated FliL family protein [Vicinamibacterales bacterium]